MTKQKLSEERYLFAAVWPDGTSECTVTDYTDYMMRYGAAVGMGGPFALRHGKIPRGWKDEEAASVGAKWCVAKLNERGIEAAPVLCGVVRR